MGNAPESNQYTVDLTGENACNAQYVTITLTGIVDPQGNTLASASATMGLLLGDTTADGVVNSADIDQTRRQSGQVAVNANFRNDVSTDDGVINSADITVVRKASGTALP